MRRLIRHDGAEAHLPARRPFVGFRCAEACQAACGVPTFDKGLIKRFAEIIAIEPAKAR